MDYIVLIYDNGSCPTLYFFLAFHLYQLQKCPSFQLKWVSFLSGTQIVPKIRTKICHFYPFLKFWHFFQKIFNLGIDVNNITKSKKNHIISEVCSLRLDFNTFDIQAGTGGTTGAGGAQDTTSACQDTFAVTTSSNNDLGIPVICGRNSDQHSK